MPRWLLLILSVALAGLIGPAGLMLYKGTSPSEVTELLFFDAVVQLNEEMRPPRTEGPRVLVVALLQR
jgi:hypothetical protein